MDARVKPEHDELVEGGREQTGIMSLHRLHPPDYPLPREPARYRASTSDMRATPEFLKFTEQFHQDVFDSHESRDEVIEAALESLSKQEQEDLRKFLASAITSDTSDDGLLELWNEAESDFYLTEASQVRDFYNWVLSRISP